MIIREIDWRSPTDAFAPMSDTPYAALLHGGESSAEARWSFVAAFPSVRIEMRDGRAFVDGRLSDWSPFEAISAAHRSRRRRSAERERPPFASGLLGYLGYEMGALVEPTAKGPPSPYALPDGAFGAYDAIASFDRRERRAFVAALDARAADRLAEALGTAPVAASPPSGFSEPVSNFTQAEYRALVAEAVERIAAGAFFQVNLSQRFSTEARAQRPYDVFLTLSKGDAPFAAFLRQENAAVISNSPERFFAVRPNGNGWQVTAEPIKGTRPRGRTPEEDAALADALLASSKDRAENIMIADLTRNDLSRICRDGSIREAAICELASRASVHHLVSRISGDLREGLAPADVLRAMFPCGSITGAPKVEAMKAIADLEGVGRGPYCGAIGYVDDRGGADFSVAIRTLIVEDSPRGVAVSFSAGGGVTLKSDPDAEFEETLVKARAARLALGLPEAAR